MANTDSFIDEVTEEVRRDQLFALFRRWGWIAVLVVLGVVGGAAYREWQGAQDRARAQAFGDALLAALDTTDPDARTAALMAVDATTPEAEVILALLAAGEAATPEEITNAAATLRASAEMPGLDRRYADLALLKAEMMDPAPEAEARLILEAIAEPGRPYASLADEQLAILDIRSGDLEAGLERLRAIERSAAATAGLQQRASQLIVALESGASLVDTAPAPEPEPETVLEPGPETVPEEAQVPAEAPALGAAPAEVETPAEDPAPAVEE